VAWPGFILRSPVCLLKHKYLRLVHALSIKPLLLNRRAAGFRHDAGGGSSLVTSCPANRHPAMERRDRVIRI